MRTTDKIGLCFFVLGILMLIVVLCTLVGCEQTPPGPTPPPQIRVEMGEMTDSCAMRIFFLNHLHSWREGDQTRYSAEIQLNTPEEIAAYTREVEFLLTKLKEAKEKSPKPATKSDDPFGR